MKCGKESNPMFPNRLESVGEGSYRVVYRCRKCGDEWPSVKQRQEQDKTEEASDRATEESKKPDTMDIFKTRPR